MIVAVADTHAVLWYLYDNSKLSAAAREAIEGAFRGGLQIGISAIYLVEIVYLVEKGRFPEEALIRLTRALKSPRYPFREIAVDSAVAAKMQQVSREEVPDMPDRIVAATGLLNLVPVISRDRKIRAANLRTIW